MDNSPKESISPITFIREVRSELSKVVWPTRKQTIRLTIIVVSISVAVGLYIGGADLILTKLMELVLKK